VEELNNYLHGANTAIAGRVFHAKVDKFGCNKRVLQYIQFLQPNGGASFASP